MNPIAKNQYVSRSLVSLILILVAIALASLADTSVVTGNNPDDSDSTATKENVLVDQGLLNRMIDDRRNRLHHRQTQLREAIKDLGKNHPSVGVMKEELGEVEQQLVLWSSPTKTLTDIEDHDLRVLVVQLMIRVDQLESRNREQQFQRQGSPGNAFGGGRSRPRSH